MQAALYTYRRSCIVMWMPHRLKKSTLRALRENPTYLNKVEGSVIQSSCRRFVIGACCLGLPRPNLKGYTCWSIRIWFDLMTFLITLALVHKALAASVRVLQGLSGNKSSPLVLLSAQPLLLKLSYCTYVIWETPNAALISSRVGICRCLFTIFNF